MSATIVVLDLVTLRLLPAIWMGSADETDLRAAQTMTSGSELDSAVDPASAKTARAALPLRICGSCGAVALPKQRGCLWCNDHTTKPLVANDTSRGFWVCVEAEFTCGACRALSPLNFLCTEEVIQCLRCGADNRFDPDQMWEALGVAHATGDLCGPAPSGRFPIRGARIPEAHNAYQQVGMNRWYAEYRNSRPDWNHLCLRAAPGHPLCERCHQMLEVKEVAPDSTEPSSARKFATYCPSCGTSKGYLRPESLPEMLSTLRGVVDLEHMAESSAAHAAMVEAQGAAIVLRCPNCAATIESDGQSPIVHCGFCGAAVGIPVHRIRALGSKGPKMLKWWLYFTDVSAARGIFESEARELPIERARESASEGDLEPQRPGGWTADLLPFLICVGMLFLIEFLMSHHN